MIHADRMKSTVALNPQSVSTAATVTASVDTNGYNYAIWDVDVGLGSSDATTVKIEEGDTTSSYSAIAALTNGTATDNYTMPTANTSTSPVVRFNIDLRKRKRYLKLSVTPAVTSVVASKVLLNRAEQTPSSLASVSVTV